MAVVAVYIPIAIPRDTLREAGQPPATLCPVPYFQCQPRQQNTGHWSIVSHGSLSSCKTQNRASAKPREGGIHGNRYGVLGKHLLYLAELMMMVNESLKAHASRGKKVLCLVLSLVGQKQRKKEKEEVKRTKSFYFRK